MRYVTYDQEGNLTGCFLQELHPSHSERHFEITESMVEGWTNYAFDGEGLVPIDQPPPVALVPESITPRQGYVILSRYGLLSQVKSYFSALEGQEGEEAQIELEFAQEWKRTWPTLINAAQSFGLTDEQIDQMFIEAATL